MLKISIGFCILVLCTSATNSIGPDNEDPDNELEDFSFEIPDDYYFNDDSDMMAVSNNMDERLNVLPLDEPNKNNDFTVKEQKVKSTVLQAFSNRALKRKFSEILPILKVMTSSQKLALAALISAQITAQNGDELSLKQVKEMFGNRPDLILPLTLDIANLIKFAGEHKPLPENASVQNMQLLRRSYSSDHEIPSTSFRWGRKRKIRDATNQIEERNGIRVQNHPSMDKLPISSTLTTNERSYHERKLNMTAFYGVEDQLAMPSQKSYQIVKPDEPASNHDLEKTLREYIKQNLTLEEIEKLSFSQLNGTSIEEFDLKANDADYDDEDYDMPENTSKNNETDDEDIPQAEKLISIRVKNGAPLYTKSKSSFRKRPPILPANGLSTGLEMKNCEKFGNVCLRTPEYPMEQIMGSIRRNQHAMTALLAEYRDKFAETHLDTNLMYLRRRNDNVQQPGGMCPSVVRYARPQKARSAIGEVKYIVNTGQHSQTLRLEKCTTTQESCSYLTDSYRSRCVQVFNYHRLLSWDKVRGLHVDIFKVPTCCSCHIDGYREKYPPFFSKPAPSTVSFTAQSPVSGLDHYEYKADFKPSIPLLKPPTKYTYQSLLNNNDDDDDDESDEEETIEEYLPSQLKGVYPKYTPLKTNYNFDTSYLNSDSLKYTPFESTASSKKKQKLDNIPFLPSSPVLESFLSAPTHDYSNLATSSYDISAIKYHDPFKQRGPTSGLQSSATTIVKPKRRPVSRRDQSADDSELKSLKIPFEDYEITTIRPKRVQIVRAVSTPTPKPVTRRPTTTTTTTTTPRPSTIRFRPRFTTIATTTSTKPTRFLQDYNNKRINYNYHPIIDFFEDGEFYDDTDGDIGRDNHSNFNDRIDRIGAIIRFDRNKWRPVRNTKRRLRM